MPVKTPDPVVPSQGWPLWRYAALAVVLGAFVAAGLGVQKVVRGKLDQRLTVEMGPGLLVPGDAPGSISESLGAALSGDGGLIHLGRGPAGKGYRLQRYDSGLKFIAERAWSGDSTPVALSYADGAVWVATKEGKLGRVRGDLGVEALQATPLSNLRAAAAIPGGRFAALDSSGGRLMLWQAGQAQGEEPIANRLLAGLAVAASAEGRVAVAEAQGKGVRIHVLGADGQWQRSFKAMDLAAGPYVKLAWSGPAELVVNDTSGPRGILLFDADSGHFLGQAVQSRQHDHLFNVSFIAGAPQVGAFVVRTTTGISWARLARPQPALWSAAPAPVEKP